MTNNGTPEKDQESIPAAEQQSAKEKEKPPARETKRVSIPESELEQLKNEASEFKDKYLRTIADAENLRKRLHKERHDLTQLAIQSIIVNFLDPIDHLENALAHMAGMSDDVKNWAIGFRMILNQFKEILATNDVHPFKSVGMVFDPHNHEAVEMIETSDYPPGIVIGESIRGYKMGSKTIRPARVKVSKEPSTSKPPEQKIMDNDEKKSETE